MWRFAPDLDPTTPNIYTAMARMIPTPWGTFRSCPAKGSNIGGFTQTAAPLAAYIVQKSDATERWITGTATKLWDSTDGGVNWTDRSGTAYSASTTQRWDEAQYGDVSVLVQLGNNPQASSSGAFADLAGSPPKFAIIVAQSNALIGFNYNDGTAYGDGWWASDIGAHTTWTPASSNQAANGRLLATPGRIKAAIAFNGKVIAAKDSSIYEGQYVGRPTIWQWRVLHRSIGVSSLRGMATNGELLFLYGKSGCYVYDGANFTRVDGDVYKYLPGVIPAANADVVWSALERCFVIHTIGSAAGLFVSYCPESQLWAPGTNAEGAALGDAVAVQVPSDFSGRYIAANHTGGTAVGHYLITSLTYSTVVTSVTTGLIGRDDQITHISGVVPLIVPAGDYSYGNFTNTTYPAQLTLKSSKTRGVAVATVGSAQNFNTTEGRFDVNHSNKWHEITIADMSGSVVGSVGGVELAGIALIPEPKYAGRN